MTRAAAAESVTIRVGIPHGSLSHNGRAHWRTISGRRKQQRGLAKYATLEALTNNPLASVCHDKRNAWKAATIEVRAFYKKKNGPGVDADNLIGSLKGAVDGIVDAGLLADDNGVRWGEVNIAYGDKDPRVELTVRRLATPARAAGGGIQKQQESYSITPLGAFVVEQMPEIPIAVWPEIQNRVRQLRAGGGDAEVFLRTLAVACNAMAYDLDNLFGRAN